MNFLPLLKVKTGRKCGWPVSSLLSQIGLGRAIMSGAVNLASDEPSLSSHPEGQEQRERTTVL